MICHLGEAWTGVMPADSAEGLFTLFIIMDDIKAAP